MRILKPEALLIIIIITITWASLAAFQQEQLSSAAHY